MPLVGSFLLEIFVSDIVIVCYIVYYFTCSPRDGCGLSDKVGESVVIGTCGSMPDHSASYVRCSPNTAARGRYVIIVSLELSGNP